MTQINKAIKILKEGNTFLYPTDTVWGLGCDATNFEAVSKIYALKNRSESKSLIVLVSSISMLKKYVSVPENVISLIKKSTQPTTIIYNSPRGFAKNTIAVDGSIAIRIVQDDFCRKLIKRFQKPIISTSANVSGEPTPKSFQEITQPILDGVDYIVDLHQNRIQSKSSTILKVGDGEVTVLRA